MCLCRGPDFCSVFLTFFMMAITIKTIILIPLQLNMTKVHIISTARSLQNITPEVFPNFIWLNIFCI